MQKITFQGAPGAYSHIACKELFPGADYIASDTFEQAMELVDNGEADFAVPMRDGCRTCTFCCRKRI